MGAVSGRCICVCTFSIGLGGPLQSPNQAWNALLQLWIGLGEASRQTPSQSGSGLKAPLRVARWAGGVRQTPGENPQVVGHPALVLAAGAVE